MMNIVLFGSNGTLGSVVQEQLHKLGHRVIGVSRTRGEFRADIQDRSSLRALFAQIRERFGEIDAVASAAGEIAFKPILELAESDWDYSLQNKLMGQIRLVHEAVPFMKAGGSFTLISGILGHVPVSGGAAASVVSMALEGFVMAAYAELPKALRINIVSPTVLSESMETYGPYFAGFTPVDATIAARAYVRSIQGVQSGQVFKVGY